jgi:CBS domain-containing protein
VETSAIIYRVADFLKQHPPFQAMEEADLLALAAHGRVRFHEAHDYILWQGERHRHDVFVIQQGTVSLWDEGAGRAELRDVRGAGDMLGIERFNDAASCPHSARSATDVVIYAFPATEFEALLLKYPYASQYVSAQGQVTTDYEWTSEQRDPQGTLLHDLVAGKTLESCGAHDSIGEVASLFVMTGAEALAVLTSEGRVSGVVTARAVLAWVAAGGGDARQPVTALLHEALPAVAPDAVVSEGVLALGAADAGVLAMTSDGTHAGSLHAVVTARDLAPIFGDQPVAILREIRRAADTASLRMLNQRARAFAHRYLTGGSAVAWLTRFTHAVDVSILERIISLAGATDVPVCWCFCGPSGRGETLAKVAPQVVVILGDEAAQPRALEAYEQVLEALVTCDYLAPDYVPFDRTFHVASSLEWKRRYAEWVADPVRTQMYQARPLFDLRRIQGPAHLWRDVETTIVDAVDLDFLRVLANDCLANLPPLTFFQDAVVDEYGEHMAVFRLEHSVLRPLVDVGRVFGLATRQAFGRSTLERFSLARTLLPEHAAVFRDAGDTLRIVLWQQGRVGISQGTDGSELPPALLSRYDRQVLKSGFRSILRLLEFTEDLAWLQTL